MKPQQILQNPGKAIEERWRSASECPFVDEIERLVATAKQLKSRIKALKAEKGALSREFRDKALTDNDINEKKELTRRVAKDLKSNETDLRTTLHALESLFSREQAAPALPDRFAAKNPEMSDLLANEVILAEQSLAELWDSYVLRHAQTSIYHQYSWKHTFETAHGITGHYIAALAGPDQIVGVLPCFLLNSRLFGKFLVSIPYVNYGGPLADNERVERALLDYAKSLATNLSADHLEIRSLRELNEWPKRVDKVSMVLPLPDKQQLLMDQIGAKTRAQIKQASRYGARCKFGKAELLDDFYSVFARNMRDLGTPVYGKQFFKKILTDFEDSAHIVVVYHEDKPAAAGFLIASGETLEIPWASSLREKNHLNVNMFMYAKVLGFAIDQGHKCFDFGRSTIDSPTYRFKKQWGAQPVEHYWHYSMQSGGQLPAVNPDNPKYKLLINIWQRLPVWITKLIGPHIVRHIP